MSASIWLVVGTRPEAIKLSPVARALVAEGLTATLVLTGQHAALDPAAFGLGDLATIRLDCPGLADPDDHAANVCMALSRLLQESPAMIVVQGDTSSAYGAAQAAFASRVPVAHVEAGLRTHDLDAPWPEEGYRTAIDARAALLFAPTDGAADNLGREGVLGDVIVTGNSGVDATLALIETLPPPSARRGDCPHVLVTAHRRESWGAGLDSIASAVRAIAESGLAEVELILHPNEHVAAAMRAALDSAGGVRLTPACGHAELLAKMRDTDLVLSDSGGMQEEAPVLGVPMLVLRAKTERPEGIASGNALLVGTDRDTIVAEVTRLLSDPGALARMAEPAMPYGDGKAAPRIAAAIAAYVKHRRR